MPFLNSSATYSTGTSSTVEDLTAQAGTGNHRTFTTSAEFSSCKIWIGGVLQYPGGQGNITLNPEGSTHNSFFTNRDIDPDLEDVIIEYT